MKRTILLGRCGQGQRKRQHIMCLVHGLRGSILNVIGVAGQVDRGKGGEMEHAGRRAHARPSRGSVRQAAKSDRAIIESDLRHTSQ